MTASLSRGQPTQPHSINCLERVKINKELNSHTSTLYYVDFLVIFQCY